MLLNEHVTDGMDITFCAINNEKNEFYFSGANNPLWIIRNKELLVFKGDKQPIGSHQNMHPFSSQKVDIQPKDKIYLFSDGIVDQFGGVKGKKFKTAGLTELLLSISEIPITEQGVSLNSSFDSWKGDLEQLDDVCILGFEV